MELLENRRYQCVFVIVCDNPSQCVLNTVQFTHVATDADSFFTLQLAYEYTWLSMGCCFFTFTNITKICLKELIFS